MSAVPSCLAVQCRRKVEDPYSLNPSNSHGLDDSSSYNLKSHPISVHLLAQNKRPNAGKDTLGLPLQSPTDDPFITSQHRQVPPGAEGELTAKQQADESSIRRNDAVVELGKWLHVCVVHSEEYDSALEAASKGWVGGRVGQCLLKLPPLGAELEHQAQTAVQSAPEVPGLGEQHHCSFVQ